jgi:hypothetical protein
MSKHADLAQFGPAFIHNLLRLVKGTAKPKHLQEKSVINMI